MEKWREMERRRDEETEGQRGGGPGEGSEREGIGERRTEEAEGGLRDGKRWRDRGTG